MTGSEILAWILVGILGAALGCLIAAVVIFIKAVRRDW